MRASILLLLASAALSAQTPEKLFQERKFDEARSAASAQLAANKNDATAMYWMGRVARAENKTDEAIGWFEKAVKADDKSALYHFWLGSAVGNAAQNASKLRQPFLARRTKAEFERAVALDPTMIDARQGLADFYQMAPGFMGGSNEKAREQVNEIRKLNSYSGHFAGARYADRDQDLNAAAKEWEAAIALAPDSLQPYFNLAGVYRRQSKWQEAFATYERITRQFPNDVIAHLGWGATAVLSNTQLERGEKELKYFLAHATVEKAGTANMAGAHFRLGQLYEKTNRPPEAKASYSEALKLNPQHADAKKALNNLK
jgi:tetratricopeptide (TPR) repeat protein